MEMQHGTGLDGRPIIESQEVGPDDIIPIKKPLVETKEIEPGSDDQSQQISDPSKVDLNKRQDDRNEQQSEMQILSHQRI